MCGGVAAEAPNNAVERTGHSVGFVLRRGSVRLWPAAHRGRYAAPYSSSHYMHGDVQRRHVMTKTVRGYPATSARCRGWLRYLYRKATTPDNWDKESSP